jgi:site-specific DNA-cytosine methylase
MHHGVPQSRDRIYVVWTRDGLAPDLELEVEAWCPRCDEARVVRQAWKNGRTVGRYRQQWVWACTMCRAVCEPSARAASTIIDWELDCPRIGDRRTKKGKPKPLAVSTRARILAGLQRYGWAPITTSGAGNVHERTPGNRARSVEEPLPVQQTTATSALATPPGFLFQSAHGGRVSELDEPHPTVCASDDRQALIVRSYGFKGSGSLGRFSSSEADPMPTFVTTQRPALIVPMRRTKGHQSLLVPYNRTGRARPVEEPAPTQTTRDRVGLVDVEAVVDDCGVPNARAVRGCRGDGVPGRLHPARRSEEGPGQARRQCGDATGHAVDRWSALASARGRGVTSVEVRAIGEWATNADLIADVARLGYLDGTVLDATYGAGTFWKVWRPDQLVTNDRWKPADRSDDYRALPWERESFDSVVFDPPYKLNGTPALAEQDARYGTVARTSRAEVLEDIRRGALECFRVCRRFLLVKCQDQVEGGQVRWQTDMVTRTIEDVSGRKVDRFDFVSNGRPQPPGRRQLTARRNHSTLLVFGKSSNVLRGVSVL